MLNRSRWSVPVVAAFPYTKVATWYPVPVLAPVTTEDVFAVLAEEMAEDIARGRAALLALFGPRAEVA